MTTIETRGLLLQPGHNYATIGWSSLLTFDLLVLHGVVWKVGR